MTLAIDSLTKILPREFSAPPMLPRIRPSNGVHVASTNQLLIAGRVLPLGRTGLELTIPARRVSEAVVCHSDTATGNVSVLPSLSRIVHS